MAKKEDRIAGTVIKFYSRLLDFLQAPTCNLDEVRRLTDVATTTEFITLEVCQGRLRRYHDSFHTGSLCKQNCHHIYQAAFRDLSRWVRDGQVRSLLWIYSSVMNNLPGTPQQNIINIKVMAEDRGPGIVTIVVSSVTEFLMQLRGMGLSVSVSKGRRKKGG